MQHPYYGVRRKFALEHLPVVETTGLHPWSPSGEIDAPGLEAAINMEDRNQILCSQTNDVREGMTAFLEKRKPNYTNS